MPLTSLTRSILLVWLVLIVPAKAAGFSVEDSVFLDPDRDRAVPYRLYLPDGPGPHPVILFSHGLGGSRDGYSVFGEAFAANGFASLHIQHLGSDKTVWEDRRFKLGQAAALLKSLKDPQNAIDRFEDIPFVLDALTQTNGPAGPYEGRFDLGRIGMAGHSYGAHSTLTAAGARVGPTLVSFKEPRIKAGMALSPNTPAGDVDLTAAYRDIDIPLFHITGTQDKSPLPGQRDMDPEQRTLPYRTISGPPQYLLVLDDADHMAFSGARLGTPKEKPRDRNQMDIVLEAAIAFFDATLNGSEEAEAWLKGTLHTDLHPADRFEFK